MTLAYVLTSLDMDASAAPQIWQTSWDRIQADFDRGRIAVLRDGFWNGAYGCFGLSRDVVDALRAAAAAVGVSEPLARLLWLWYRLGVVEGEKTDAWPVPNSAKLLRALTILEAFPAMVEGHRKRNLPLEVTYGVCKDLEIWMRHEKRIDGEWGFKQFGWMMNHVTGKLYRIGRLQFIHQAYRGAAYAYRNRSTGQVLALSAPGVRYAADGSVDGCNGRKDEAAWVSTLEDDETSVIGHPIHPDGRVLRQPVSLRRDEWSPVLAKGDATLDVHIPEDGRLSPELFMESFYRAPSFYAEYFSDLPTAVAFTCGSWLLDWQYADILPENSNIVMFQRVFYRYPLLSSDDEHFWRVFDGRPQNLTKAPRDTGLRRAIIDFTLAGGRLRSAGGFIPLAFIAAGASSDEVRASYWRPEAE